MTTASYEDEGVAERRAQKAPRRWVASSERESQIVTYGARTTCGSGSRAVASPGRTRAA